jgi:hypothetical protein
VGGEMIKQRLACLDILFRTSPDRVRFLYTFDTKLQTRNGKSFIAQSFIDGKTIGPNEMSYWDD